MQLSNKPDGMIEPVSEHLASTSWFISAIASQQGLDIYIDGLV